MTLDPRLRRLVSHALPGGLTVLLASDRRARRRGLAGLETLPADHGLLLEPCRSVHTIGMRFALDLLWLGSGDELVHVDAAVAAWRVRSRRHARAVIECRAGEGERFAAAIVAAGDGWRAPASQPTETG